MKNEWLSKNIKPAIFYIVFFLFILAFSTTANGYDFDLWARLIVGKGIIQTGQVFTQDFLSYTPTHTWYDHEWGSSVIFYLAQHYFSSIGILILQSILIFLIFFFITKIVQLRGVKTTSAFNFLFYYFAFSAMSDILNSPIRCQLFSFLFFTMFLYILELARKDKNKPLFLIPFLMIIWNNLHGGCLSGIGLILIYVVGELLNKKSVKKYIFALLSSIIVLPINPWGFGYIKFLLNAGTMQRTYVREWWGLFCKLNLMLYLKFKLFVLLLLTTQIGLIIKEIKTKKFNFDKTKFLILLATLILAIQHAKLIPFFVISATCFLYDDFYTVFNSITKNIFNKIANYKDTIIYTLIIIFTLFNMKNLNKILINPEQYPILSVEFIKENNLKGNLLTNFGLGSYAAYKLYPNNKIYMDGRYEEIYPDFLMEDLKNFYYAEANWDKLLKTYPTEILLIEKYYKVYNIIQAQKEWKLVYDKDKNFGVFVKADTARIKYKQPPTDINYYKKTLFDTNINFKK